MEDFPREPSFTTVRTGQEQSVEWFRALLTGGPDGSPHPSLLAHYDRFNEGNQRYTLRIQTVGSKPVGPNGDTSTQLAFQTPLVVAEFVDTTGVVNLRKQIREGVAREKLDKLSATLQFSGRPWHAWHLKRMRGKQTREYYFWCRTVKLAERALLYLAMADEHVRPKIAPRGAPKDAPSWPGFMSIYRHVGNADVSRLSVAARYALVDKILAAGARHAQFTHPLDGAEESDNPLARDEENPFFRLSRRVEWPSEPKKGPPPGTPAEVLEYLADHRVTYDPVTIARVRKETIAGPDGQPDELMFTEPDPEGVVYSGDVVYGMCGLYLTESGAAATAVPTFKASLAGKQLVLYAKGDTLPEALRLQRPNKGGSAPKALPVRASQLRSMGYGSDDDEACAEALRRYEALHAAGAVPPVFSHAGGSYMHVTVDTSTPVGSTPGLKRSAPDLPQSALRATTGADVQAFLSGKSSELTFMQPGGTMIQMRLPAGAAGAAGSAAASGMPEPGAGGGTQEPAVAQPPDKKQKTGK
jgi:hypothetical protein